MGKVYKAVSTILTFTMLLTLCAGCGDNSNNTDNAESSGTGEVVLSVTDEHYDTYTISEIEELDTIYCFDKTDDTYTVLGTDTTGTLTTLYKYTSTDEGLNWEREEVIGEDDDLETNDGLTKQITCAALNSGGSIIIGYGASDSEGYVESYIIEKRNNGSMEEVATADANDTYIRKIRSSESDGNIYVYFDESIIKYDESGNLSYEINIPELIDFEIGDSEIYVLTIDALYTYDCETGEEISEDIGVTKALAEEISAAYENSQSDVLNCKRIIKLNENKDALYFMLEETIYEYDLENSGNMCQVDCDKKSGEYVYDFLVDETNSTNTKIAAISSGDEEAKLIAYSPAELETNYDEEENKYADEEPAEITVYSLRYAEFMEGMIDIYENIHPNITVNYEYGVSDENGVTVSDAVNALNTEIIAGEGPDVILMDGLNVNDYIENEALMDLSEVYSEIIEENPNCLETVMKTYEKEDELFAIPSKIQFSVIAGDEAEIETVTDIESLTAYIKENETTDVVNDLNIYDWEILFEIFYPLYSTDIVDFEENFSEEELRKFLQNMKELWESLMEHTTEEEISQYYVKLEDNSNIRQFAWYIEPLYDRDYSGQSIVIGLWDTILGVSSFYSLKNDEYSESGNYTYEVLTNDGKKVYTPTNTFAINKNTAEKNAAESFLKEMFSVTLQQTLYVQSLDYTQGIAVNLDASNSAEISWGYSTATYGNNVNYKVYGYVANEDDLEEYIEVLKTLDTASNDDRIIYEAIEDGMAEYMDGTKSLDDTVNDISSTINIYVNE